MIIGSWFFSLLIIGRIFWVGNCEVHNYGLSFNETAVRAVCILGCPDCAYGSFLCHGPCITNCTRTKEIAVLDEEAEVDVRLICRDEKYVVLAHNTGYFVIDIRNKLNNSEYSVSYRAVLVLVVTDEPVVMSELRAQESFRFYSYHVSTDGISRPETTKWIDTFPVGYHPKNATNITIGTFEEDNQARFYAWKVKISFTPAEDCPCRYEVVCQQDNGEYNKMIRLKNVQDPSVICEGLPFAANFTVTIKSLTDDLVWDKSDVIKGTIATFSTPRCLLSLTSGNCLPRAVKGLNATATHKTGKIFDVNVTWNRPNDDDDDPSEYSIDIHPVGGRTEDRLSKVVTNGVTHFVFQNVKFLDRYDVNITAINWIGKGPTVSRRFTTGLKQIDVPENIPMPIYLTVSISIIMVIGIGIAAYGYYRLRQRRLKKSIPVDEFEMNPDRLTITRVLGTGAFGVVKLGSLRDDQGNVTHVAVKMLQDDSNEIERRNFLHEIKIMKAMDEHPNIVCLLGCNTTSPYPFLVVEYCSRGDLQSFLRKSLEEADTLVENEAKKRIVPTFRSPRRREILQANSRSLPIFRNRDNYVQATSCTDEQDINFDSEVVTIMDMLNFGRQIATGMEFLSSNRVVHRDLAARNILVCCDRTVKISDFGLSRDIYIENIYKKTGNGRMPLKWMAIEALTHQVYTTFSDVWSFGILLWEIVTLGGDPYPGVPTIEILNRLQSGWRMVRPANCSLPLYNVMLSCWQTRPKDRPTFTILRRELDKLICAATEREYFDLENVLEETPLEDDDSQVPSSHSSSHPSQVAIETIDEPEIS